MNNAIKPLSDPRSMFPPGTSALRRPKLLGNALRLPKVVTGKKFKPLGIRPVTTLRAMLRGPK